MWRSDCTQLGLKISLRAPDCFGLCDDASDPENRAYQLHRMAMLVARRAVWRAHHAKVRTAEINAEPPLLADTDGTAKDIPLQEVHDPSHDPPPLIAAPITSPIAANAPNRLGGPALSSFTPWFDRVRSTAD
jgi:hypothetical protein